MSNNGGTNNNNMRGRYPPGIGGVGVGLGGGGAYANPNFQPRSFQQQYVQRTALPTNQQQQYQMQQQQQQQQQWLKKNQFGAESSVVEVEKTVQSEAVNAARCFLYLHCLLCVYHALVFVMCADQLIFSYLCSFYVISHFILHIIKLLIRNKHIIAKWALYGLILASRI